VGKHNPDKTQQAVEQWNGNATRRSTTHHVAFHKLLQSAARYAFTPTTTVQSPLHALIFPSSPAVKTILCFASVSITVPAKKSILRTSSRKQKDLTISDPCAPGSVTLDSCEKFQAGCRPNCTNSKLSLLSQFSPIQNTILNITYL